MAEQATSTRQGAKGAGDSEPADPRDELNRSREEVLRLRDLLIGKDAELGALRGRLAELEAGSGRLLNLAARVRSRIPRFVLTAGAGLRKRRGPRD
jgi:sugar/nucleoside kinase (ribokinase family)